MKNIFLKVKKMHRLIKSKSTGTPSQFAEKLGICERKLYSDIKALKEDLEAPIIYDRQRMSYCYDGNFNINMIIKLEDKVLLEIKGGHINSPQQKWSSSQRNVKF